MDASWLFNTAELTALLHSLRFPEEIIRVTADAAHQLASTPEQHAAFLAFQADWIARQRDAVNGAPGHLWHALAVAAEFPNTVKLHREREIPWEITVATLEDFPRRMLNYRKVHGAWGFDVQRWMRSHVQGRLYQLGRLQFIPGKFYYSALVYGTPEGPVALAPDALQCDAKGWPAQEGNGCWSTSLSTTADGITGHRAGPTGAYERETTRIPAGSPLLLDAESNVLHIHIPMGRKLDTAECLDSIAQAPAFFARHFPEEPCTAICCGSWLLDRAFRAFDPVPEKIVAFGELFTPIPSTSASDASHYRWCFGEGMNREKAEQVPNPTSLQRALLHYVRSGGSLHNTAGYRMI